MKRDIVVHRHTFPSAMKFEIFDIEKELPNPFHRKRKFLILKHVPIIESSFTLGEYKSKKEAERMFRRMKLKTKENRSRSYI